MNYLKRRLAVFLCAAIALTSALCMAPQTEVQAATYTNTYFTSALNSTYLEATSEWRYVAQVEAGQTFDWKNYVYAYGYDSKGVYTEITSGYKFSSSDASVASINASGIITTKKVGTTVITASYGESKREVTLDVKKAGALTTAKIRAVNKKIESLISKAGSSIKASNCYTVYNLYGDVRAAVEEAGNISSNGIKYETVNGISYSMSANKIVSPKMKQVTAIYSKLYAYGSKYDPISTKQSKWFKIKSVKGSAKTDTATITLTKKVSANQFYALQANSGYYSIDQNISAKGKATFVIIVQDVKTGYKYYSTATVKKGSNKITVKMLRGTFKKGKKYRLIGEEVDTSKKSTKYGWTKGKTFTCK